MPFQVRRGALTSLAALCAVASFAGGGVYYSTRHGDPESGVYRLDSEPRGECSQCHDQHASRGGVATGGPFPYLLFTANDNALCSGCHNGSSAHAIYPGAAPWANSSHALSASMIWPGPTPPSRPSSDAGKCVNCHDPHGASDGDGLVPSLATLREEELCIPCHDGSPAFADVRLQFQKPFVHPIGTSGRHDAAEDGNPSRYGGPSRHAECVDCHNPHYGAGDPVPPTPPNASNRIVAVGRVRVENGPAGTTPVYTWAGPEQTSFPNEYEVCFKCHSSWTTRPAGQSDLALLLNPNNPSFHPVEEAGRNRNIDPNAFVNGWSWDRLTYCSDCHSSDDPTVRGPHGSNYRHLLKADYAATSVRTPMAPSDLCFECHAWDVYANRSTPQSVRRASRFNPPAISQGHTYHVDQRGYSCFACHASHGSTLFPALIATGRVPGLAGFTQSLNGGSCSPTCHGGETYTINYPR